MTLCVIVTDHAPDRLRGYLRTHISEIRVGVFAGRLSARIREAVWQTIVDEIETGSALLVYLKDDELTIYETGQQPARRPVEIEGVVLMQRKRPPGRAGA